jgi:RHS repeat-associated protein
MELARFLKPGRILRGVTAIISQRGRGWRFRKRIGNSGPATLYHYSPDGLLLAEVGASNQIIAEYIYLEGVPLALASGGGLYYIHANHLGAPVAMTDAGRAVVWRAEYDPFGRATVTSAGPTLNLRLPGQYFDAETGLHYNMARHYDPGTGRYLQSDPIGLQGGINTYVYVENNPMNFVDPLGLFGSNSEGGMSCLTCHLRDWFDPPPVPTKPEPWLMPAPGNQVMFGPV